MKKPDHAEDQPAVRREQTEAGSPLSMDRRGFLHRSALVIGAFLVGLGRAESAFGVSTTYFLKCCNLCKTATDCPCDDGYLLHWECGLHGKKWNCIECYDTEGDSAFARLLVYCDSANRGCLNAYPDRPGQVPVLVEHNDNVHRLFGIRALPALVELDHAWHIVAYSYPSSARDIRRVVPVTGPLEQKQ